MMIGIYGVIRVIEIIEAIMLDFFLCDIIETN